MKCTHCGAVIPDGLMICPVCETEVQIVPDYNPLDDVLTREVKGSVEGATRQIQTGNVRSYRNDRRTQNIRATRVLSRNEMDRMREMQRNKENRSRQETPRRNTGYVDQRRENTGEMRRRRQDTSELRRIRQQKRLEAARRKRRNLLITMFLLLVLIAAGVYVVYQNSYTGMLKKGYASLQSGDYSSAEEYFSRAVTKDRSRPEAYSGYAQIYMDQDDLESAEDVFLTAIETQPTNEKLYQAVIDFYMETEQQGKISQLLQNCDDENVLDAVSEYISTAPELSPEEGTFSEVQEITLQSPTGGDIYYTTDGTDPDASTGTKYTEPILLQDEGTVEIRAIAVNSSGIPSVVSGGTYTIEFPIADPPAVTPSTGQYSGGVQITITVPDGYTAYYTMDGSTPTESSTRYTGPVDMPENTQTIFNAILINNKNGKATGVTTRNYITMSE